MPRAPKIPLPETPETPVNKGGRPSKFTPETRKALLDAITAGLTYTHACQTVGIDYDTLNNWRKQGAALDKPDEEGFFEFFVALTRAETNASLSMMGTVRKVAQGYKGTVTRKYDNEGNLISVTEEHVPADWRAAAWWLERRYPKEYGKQIQEISGLDGGAINIKLIRETGFNPQPTITEGDE